MIRLRRKASGILHRNRIVASEARGTNKWYSKRRISLPVIPTSSSGEPQVLKLLREKGLPSGIVSSEARGTDDCYLALRSKEELVVWWHDEEKTPSPIISRRRVLGKGE